MPIEWHRKARKAASKMHPQDVRRVGAGLEALLSGASNVDVRPLKGQPGLWRLRVGDVRAIYIQNDDVILVTMIGPRGSIYEAGLAPELGDDWNWV